MVAELSDRELLARFLSGDDHAFDALMRRHEDKIFALAYRMTGDRADALDATQDAFVTAFRKASTFRGTAAFSTWLYRIAINACHDLLRKKRRLVPTEDVDAGIASGSVDDDVSLGIDVRTALARLTPEHREAVLLHDVGGFPYEDIAALTGVQLGTVKSRISRGRKRLAELLEQRAPREPSKGKT